MDEKHRRDFVIERHDVGIYRTVESAQTPSNRSTSRTRFISLPTASAGNCPSPTDGTNTFISLDEEALPGSAELESALRHYLVAMGDDRARRAIDLPALVELAEARAR